MRVKQLFERFMQYTREHRKPATVRHYEGRLAPFARAYGSRVLKSLRPDDIDDYLTQANHWPDGTKKAPDTCRANAVVLQTMLTYAVDRGYLQASPAAKVEKPRGRKRERIPTDEELAQVEALASPAFLAIFRALLRTGARPGELCGARIEHYQPAAKRIVLKEHKTATSTGRPRVIGVGSKFGEILAAAIAGRTSGPIFLDEDGRPWTTAQISRRFKYLCKRAGLSDELCLYTLRHRHATDLCARAGIHAAALALGHASINTTQRYVHPDDEQLAVNQDLV